MVLQYWISAVLALGLVETTIEFGYYLNWNDTGETVADESCDSLIDGLC